MSVRKCAVCGKAFEAPKGNIKYCSEACRIEGTERRRKLWEERTGYKEKQRKRTAEYREKVLQEQTARNAKFLADMAERRETAIQEIQQKNKASLARRSAEGEPLACMMDAKAKGDDYSYWKYFKEYQLRFSEESGGINKCHVNGISIHEKDFEQQVISSVKEAHIIFISST